MALYMGNWDYNPRNGVITLLITSSPPCIHRYPKFIKLSFARLRNKSWNTLLYDATLWVSRSFTPEHVWKTGRIMVSSSIEKWSHVGPSFPLYISIHFQSFQSIRLLLCSKSCPGFAQDGWTKVNKIPWSGDKVTMAYLGVFLHPVVVTTRIRDWESLLTLIVMFHHFAPLLRRGTSRGIPIWPNYNISPT